MRALSWIPLSGTPHEKGVCSSYFGHFCVGLLLNADQWTIPTSSKNYNIWLNCYSVIRLKDICTLAVLPVTFNNKLCKERCQTWCKRVCFVFAGYVLQLEWLLLPPSASSPPPFCVKTNLLFCSEPETIESTNVTAARQGLLGKRWGLISKPTQQLKADYFQIRPTCY